MADADFAAAFSASDEPSDAIQIIHASVPGRVRLHVRGLRGSTRLKLLIAHGLSRYGGVRAAWPSTDTGNVLVLFDGELSVERVAGLVGHVAANGAVDDGAIAWHEQDPERITAHLGSSLEQGLSSEAADHRLAVTGPNQVPPSPGRSSFEIAAAQFQSLPTLLLAAAGAASLLTGGLIDAAAIFGVIALNTAIGYTVESRSERTIHLLGSESPAVATVTRHGARLQIPSERLVPGDIMLLARGDTVTADARLWRAHEFFVDESALTGESLPVRKDAASLPDGAVPLGDRRNMVFRGTVVTGGTGRAIVVATGAQTETGRLQRFISTASRPPTPMERELRRLGGRLTWLSVALGATAALIGVGRGLAVTQVLRTSAALAIAAIPEGLPAVASTTLARGVEVMRRLGVLVRRLDAVETLGAAQVLCFDKTGTLTCNHMAVAAVAYDVGMRELRPDDLPAPEQAAPLCRLLEIGVLCSEASIDPGDGSLAGSETETALVHLAREQGVDATELRRRQPVVSIRHRSEAYRFMATTHAIHGHTVMTAVKGDPLDVLKLCEHQLCAKATVALTPKRRAAIGRANDAMAQRGLRVLGFAFRTDTESRSDELAGLVWVGLAGLADRVRPGAAELMRALRRARIHPLVLTGDQVATARAVADQLGLHGDAHSVVVDSAELADMTIEAIGAAARRAHVFARVSPAEKLRIVQALQQAGVVVGMVGDGFNDSPALKAADVGIAMSGPRAEAARDAADIVMQTEDLGTLAVAIEQGRTAYANVQRATGYLVGTNFSEVAFVIAGTAGGLGQPLSPAQLLWINVVSDVLPGVGLSAEPPETGVMRQQPRANEQQILGLVDVKRLVAEGGIIATGALASTAWGALRFGAGPETLTIGFGSLVLGQLLHAFNRRAAGRETGGNPTFARSMGLAFGAQAVAVAMPALRRALGVAPLCPAEWAVTLAGGLVPFVVNRALRPDQSAALVEGADPVSGSAALSAASST